MGFLSELEGFGVYGGDRDVAHLLSSRPRQRTPATTFGPATPVRYEDLVAQLVPQPKFEQKARSRAPSKKTKPPAKQQVKAKGRVPAKKSVLRKPLRKSAKKLVRGNGNAVPKTSRHKACNR